MVSSYDKAKVQPGQEDLDDGRAIHYGRMNMMMSFALLLERRWVNLVIDPIRPYFL